MQHPQETGPFDPDSLRQGPFESLNPEFTNPGTDPARIYEGQRPTQAFPVQPRLPEQRLPEQRFPEQRPPAFDPNLTRPMSRAELLAFQETTKAEVRPKPWLWVGLGTTAILGLGWLFFRQTPAAPKALPAVAPEPTASPRLKPYLEQAHRGDVAAMRMLGVCYLNGLDVKANRPEALRWFRAAARAGSETAKAELKALGESL